MAENLFARVASAADARAVGRVCKDWAIGLIASCRVGWVAERGCATAERTGQWRRDWPNAERLEISLTAPSCLLRDTLVNVPELQQLKALRIERHPYRRSFVDNLPEEKLQALEELELECMIGDDLEGVFGYQHTGGGGWLRNLTALRKLSLAGCTLEPWNLWALGEALSLQDLTVAGGNFKWSSAGMGLQWLGQLVGLKRLEFRCQTTLLPGMLEHLSRLTELEHLALNGMNKGIELFEPLPDYNTWLTGSELVRVLPRLRKLKSFESTFSDEYGGDYKHSLVATDAQLQALLHLPCLQRLVLGVERHAVTPMGLHALGRLSTLTELRLDMNKHPEALQAEWLMSDDLLNAISPLTGLRTLSLSLRKSRCSSQALTRTLAGFASLTSLNLEYDELDTELWDFALQDLVEGSEQQLPVLDLSFVRMATELRHITADQAAIVIRNLPDLRHATCMQTVVLSGVWLDDVPSVSLQPQDISALACLTCLRRLDIDCVWVEDGFCHRTLDNYEDEELDQAWEALQAHIGFENPGAA